VIGGNVVCAPCKPAAIAKLQGGQQIGGGGVWRERKLVVMGARAELPDRCIKCNVPANGARLKRRLYWHHPAWYLFLLLTPFGGFLIYLIVAIAARKRATIHVGLCEKHRGRRWMHIGIAWALVLGGIAATVVGTNDPKLAALAGAGALAILTGIIWGLAGGRAVTARRIDQDWIRFQGARRDFLDSLVDFPKVN